MFESLRRHPFGVEAVFRSSLVLTYAVPATSLVALAGPGLEVDAYDGWGFLAIAMVDTRALRPRGFPRWLGQDFFLTGYRIFTRFARPGQQPLRGLRIVRSDTNKKTMASLGNVFTHYQYRLATVDLRTDPRRFEVRITTPDGEADLHVEADLASRPAPLPEGTPFRSTEDARAFAGPLPYTFDHEPESGKMVVVRGLRQAWDPQPVAVKVHVATYLERGPWAGLGAKLANAFYLENVPYSWKPGVLEDLS